MEQLLCTDYPQAFGLTRRTILISKITKFDIFDVCDAKACHQCPHECQNKGILKVFSDIDVTELDIEEYFKQFQNTRADVSGSRCDKLMYDNQGRRIAFVELTCKEVTEERNLLSLDSKRTKAYEQLKNSIDKLKSTSSINARIDSFSVKSAIFAYRQNDLISSLSSVLKDGVSPFIKPMQLAENHNLSVDMGNGFDFHQIRYPELLKW